MGTGCVVRVGEGGMDPGCVWRIGWGWGGYWLCCES